jgi:hypothetical protein
MDELYTISDTKSDAAVLRRRFGRFVHSRPPGRTWRNSLQDMLARIRDQRWTAYAFGGTARELLHHGPSVVPRDIDLVFASEHFESFKENYNGFVRSVNRFGGLRMRIGHVDLDVWPIERTWAFSIDRNLIPSFSNLPKTTFLNIDALAIELFPRPGRPRQIYDGGCFEAHRSRVLDINFVPTLLPDLCVVRVLRSAYRFGFGISTILRSFLVSQMNALGLETLVLAQERHYGQVWFDKAALLRIVAALERNGELALAHSSDLAGL